MPNRLELSNTNVSFGSLIFFAAIITVSNRPTNSGPKVLDNIVATIVYGSSDCKIDKKYCDSFTIRGEKNNTDRTNVKPNKTIYNAANAFLGNFNFLGNLIVSIIFSYILWNASTILIPKTEKKNVATITGKNDWNIYANEKNPNHDIILFVKLLLLIILTKFIIDVNDDGNVDDDDDNDDDDVDDNDDNDVDDDDDDDFDNVLYCLLLVVIILITLILLFLVLTLI